MGKDKDFCLSDKIMDTECRENILDVIEVREAVRLIQKLATYHRLDPHAKEKTFLCIDLKHWENILGEKLTK